MSRLWTPHPAGMKTVVELYNKDRLAYPDIPHMFALPYLMTHMRRKKLSKDVDVFSLSIFFRPFSSTL